MKIYLVGGAVRDQLLGYPIKERDWVVVGATPQRMLDLGYRPVGKDFPVFLHPTTHEEYALARTERKTGPGYKGFHFHAAPDVTLEEDLRRRDLTINAMAQTPSGEIIDPYGGRKDLQAGLFRHVSAAFMEDPVRILRLARFATRFANFQIHPHTQQLLQDMVQLGEVNALVAERVWQEWAAALQEACPIRFFQVLASCGALKVLLPELSENKIELAAVQRTAQLNLPVIVRFAVLLRTLNASDIHAVSQRYRVPNDYTKLALAIREDYPTYNNVLKLNAEAHLSLLERLDALRRPERLDLFLSACEAIADEPLAAQKSQQVRTSFAAIKTVKIHDLVAQGADGQEIKKILRTRQITAIQQQ